MHTYFQFKDQYYVMVDNVNEVAFYQMFHGPITDKIRWGLAYLYDIPKGSIIFGNNKERFLNFYFNRIRS